MYISFCRKCGAVRADRTNTTGTVLCPDCHSEMESKGEFDWESMTIAQQNDIEKSWQAEAGMDNNESCCPVCGRVNAHGSYICLCGYNYKTREISKQDINAAAKKKSNWPIVICVAIIAILAKVFIGSMGALDGIVLGIIFYLIFVPLQSKKIIEKSGCKIVYKK